MTSYGSTTLPIKQSRAKLHKRGHSASSTPASGPPSSLRGSSDTFTTPFATYEEPTAEITSPQPLPTSSTPKLKPYLRKTSSTAKDDQGQIDLSRSTQENERLAGLGIVEDPGIKAASDVPFASSVRRRTTSHTRTVSGCSSVSNGSASYKPTLPFVHPMRQTPSPYTPPIGHSGASSLNEEEANESSDMVEDEFKPGYGYRSRRSMSISSSAQNAPTPLSQSHTALDLGIVPKLTSNPSQTRLSIDSSSPPKQSQSRSRGESSISQEQAISPSARTSIDKAFSFVSRKSDLELHSREDRIREARRKFEEKEADKDRKAEKEAHKRQESDRSKSYRREEKQARKSEASERNDSRRPSTITLQKRNKKDARNSANEKVDARPYENYAESNEASLPVRGRKAGASEKTPALVQEYRPKPAKGGWIKFEAWVRTRVSSCGGERKKH